MFDSHKSDSSHDTIRIGIVAAVFFSVCIHLLFFLFVFYHSTSVTVLSSLWSGGGQGGTDTVTFVELAKIDINDSEIQNSSDTPPQQNQTHSSKNPIHVSKQKETKNKKTSQNGNGNNTIIKKSQGTGQSDTSNNGHGIGLDAGSSSQYVSNLAKIRKKIMRNKTYPLVAKQNHWTGSVKVSFRINENGNLETLNIIKSSGIEILDQAALSCLKKAQPYPFYPDTIAITLEYQLVP